MRHEATSLKEEFFENSAHHTECSWKGQCSYYTVKVGGRRLILRIDLEAYFAQLREEQQR